MISPSPTNAQVEQDEARSGFRVPTSEKSRVSISGVPKTGDEKDTSQVVVSESMEYRPRRDQSSSTSKPNIFIKVKDVLVKYARFTGPGTIIGVAYIDPDNFQVAIAAGAQFQYKLLCVILLGILMAIYLQALATKLGCVTGMDLAQMNRAHLPKWLNISLYIVAELAIVATDIGQVIGTAIAINILIPKIPLVGGCAISVTDTLFILLFYRRDGTLRRIRAFEIFVSVFVVGVFVSFCIELSYLDTPPKEVFRGFVPSKEIFVSQGLYQSCAILGGIMMPHSLYLGSGIVQSRMKDHELDEYNQVTTALASNSKYSIPIYRPTLSAIQSCLSYSIAEICISLFVISLFINSAILIISATALTADALNADLPGIYQLFVITISQASGTIFAIALLFSGVSAGIVCTMAGQLVCEGAFDWRMSPFFRRLITRSISVVPAVIIAGSGGQIGLAKALSACNVVLAVCLIFVTAPLVWYTSFEKYMRVGIDGNVVGVVDGVVDFRNARVNTGDSEEEGSRERQYVSMANGWTTTIIAWIVWGIVVAFNVSTLVLLALGIVGNDG